MKAKDLMTKNPRTCEPGHDLLCALRLMKDEDTGIVPVTEGNGEARVAGVVTDRDIALVLGSRDVRPSEVKVGDVMSKKVVSVRPTDIDALQQKVTNLEQRLVDVTARLAARDDDLDAARSANRELMGQLNHLEN